MTRATPEFLASLDALADKRRSEILNSPDNVSISGTKYYVSENGDNSNDGLTPETAWRTLDKVSEAPLESGDAVLFERGGLFRGTVVAKGGVTYAAYGEGDKPKLYAYEKSVADPSLWTLYDADHNIWKYNEPILDVGNIVFNNGERHCRKLIPSYIRGQFLCRGHEKEGKVFVMADEMTQDLDLYCRNDAKLITQMTKGEDFPIPAMYENPYGEMYLRCDKGNPGEVFEEAEAVPRVCVFRVKDDFVTIDNLCIMYAGIHGISAGGERRRGLHVTNCVFGWIGGCVQSYTGTDPNWVPGIHGEVTRFGNGIEVYGGCDDYLVENCYLYQIYDAGITHQVTTNGRKIEMTNIRYLNNLVEYCVYSIEYFLDQTEGDNESYIKDCVMSGNFLRFAGYGWGQQRHNIWTPAHIKGWSYVNTASDYVIKDNIFDRSAYRIMHTVALKEESCPLLEGNTYVQTMGGTLGQWGGNENGEPADHSFDENAERILGDVWGENGAKVYFI